jgi:hypothetical protein
MYLRTKFVALLAAGAGAAASLALAAAPALASGQAADHGGRITPEIADGAIYGQPATAQSPVIPLTWRGLVNTRGTFVGHGTPPGKGEDHTFATAAGNLVGLVTATPRQGQTFNSTNCHFTATVYVSFTAVPSKSTGRFAGVTGPGAVEVYFAGNVARYMSGPKKGQCNSSPNAPELAKGAVVSFALRASLASA